MVASANEGDITVYNGFRQAIQSMAGNYERLKTLINHEANPHGTHVCN